MPAEQPPRKTSKVEHFAPTDLGGEVLDLPPVESSPIEFEPTLSRLNDPTPGEFKKTISGMFEKMKGLHAVSGSEVRKAAGPLNLEGKYDGKPESANDNGGSQESLAPSLSKFTEMADTLGVGKERTAMQSAENEYLQKYKEFHKKNGLLGRLGKDISNHADSEQLETLKKKYDQSRLEYAKSISSASKAGNSAPSPAFKSRMEARYAKMIQAGETPKDYFNKPLSLEQYVEAENTKRNEALAKYATFREVIKPAAEKKIAARTEALDAKGKNAFEKGLGWVAEKNQALEKKLGKNGARAVRALASTIVVAGGAAAVGSFGTAGLLAMAGWGTFKFGKAFAGSMIGAAAGEVGAKAYEKFRGKSEQEKAKKTLKGLGKNGDVYLESLAALDAKREKLLGRADERTLENKKNLVKALVAFGVGAGTAASFAELQSLQHASHAVTDLEKFGHMPTHEQMEQLARGEKNGHYFYENRPNASAGHELEVGGNIRTSDQLLGHFAEKLQQDFSNVGEAQVPKSVTAYHELFATKPGVSLLQGEDHASMELGLRGHHGLSEIMHKGDTIDLNKQGQIVIHWADHARPPHVLIDADGEVNMDTDDLQGAGHMGGVHHIHHGAHTTEHAAATHEAPKTVPIAETSNADELPKNVKDIMAAEVAKSRAESAPPTAHVAAHATHESHNYTPASEHLATSSPTLQKLMETPGWSNMRDVAALDVVTGVDQSDSSAVLMRERFMEVVSKSQIMPEPDQTVEQYIKIVEKAMENK